MPANSRTVCLTQLSLNVYRKEVTCHGDDSPSVSLLYARDTGVSLAAYSPGEEPDTGVYAFQVKSLREMEHERDYHAR